MISTPDTPAETAHSPSTNSQERTRYHLPEVATEMDLSGTGRHFLWSTVPTVVTLAGSVFLLSFSVHRLGPAEYGSVVAIGALTSILTLFSGALRYAVMRHGAASAPSRAGIDPEGNDAAAIRAAHALFVIAAVAIMVASLAIGWSIPLDLGLHGPEALRVYAAAIIFLGGAAVLLLATSFPWTAR